MGLEGVLHISEVDLLQYSLHGGNTISVMLLKWTFADSFHPLYYYGYILLSGILLTFFISPVCFIYSV